MTWLLAALSLVGVVLNIRKCRACFAIFLVTNSAWCLVDLHAGLPAQAALFAVYAVLAVWGLRAWKDSPANTG